MQNAPVEYPPAHICKVSFIVKFDRAVFLGVLKQAPAPDTDMP